MTNPILSLAANVRKLRMNQGLSQEHMALKAGLHPALISRLERGLANPTIKTTEKIAGALGVDITTILHNPTKLSVREIRGMFLDSISEADDETILIASMLLRKMFARKISDP